MPRIVTRSEWGARAPKTAPNLVPVHARSATCIHYDGANPITVKTFGDACALVRRDQSYHMDSNGWADIGYNYLTISAPGTPVDGLIFEGRGRDAVGAHCENHNTEWIGIQVAIGGDQQPSPAALTSARWLHDTFQRAARHPLAMRGHSDGYPTACPGPTLLAWVRAGMPVQGAPVQPAATPTKDDDMDTTQDTRLKNVETMLARIAFGVDPGGVTPFSSRGELTTRLRTIDAHTIAQPTAVNAAAIAKAVAAALPASGAAGVTAAQLEAALRVVLGSVDGK